MDSMRRADRLGLDRTGESAPGVQAVDAVRAIDEPLYDAPHPGNSVLRPHNTHRIYP